MKVRYGYMGKMLFVNLTNRKIHEEELSDELARNYIGGYGIGARIMMERMRPGVDPLGPDNIFGIGTGPLTLSGDLNVPVSHNGKIASDKLLGRCKQWREFCQCA